MPTRCAIRRAIFLLAFSIGHAADAAAAITTRSTFESVSIYWNPPGGGTAVRASVQYRTRGGAWKDGHDLWYAQDVGLKEYRGSIVYLAPGTTYQVKLSLADGHSEMTTVTTRSDTFKIAKTIPIGSRSTMFQTAEGGSASGGYVLYDGTGSTIDVADGSDHCVRVLHNFVMIRGLVCRSARIHGIAIEGADDVVIEGTDISGWGRLRKQQGSQTWAVDNDSALFIDAASERIVVQGNKLHHPRYDTNTWEEDGHPFGNIGIHVQNGNPGGHIFRYNEIYSDEDHLFEDCMESPGGNWGRAGFPGADSDVYGNYIAQCADDGIEADGGGRNVRIWGNFIDRSHAAISTAAVNIGPIYVFRNVINTMAYPNNWTAFKFTAHRSSDRGRKYFYHNTVLGSFSRGLAVPPPGTFKETVTRNNVLMTTFRSIDNRGGDPTVRSSFDYDLSSKAGRGLPSGSQAHGLENTNAQWREGHGPASGRGGRYQLAAGSRGQDDGLVIPNFNDGFEGAAPDMGAHEFGSPDMKFGLAAWRGGGTAAPSAAASRPGRRHYCRSADW